MSEGVRRVVTGLDAEGKSTLLFDDRASTERTQILWQSPSIPADNSGDADAAIPFSSDILRSRGTTFLLAQFKPGQGGPFMHATDTLDYFVVVRGRVRMTVETGSVELAAGDCIVNRGVMHGWEVLGDEPVIMASAVIPSDPVASGATI